LLFSFVCRHCICSCGNKIFIAIPSLWFYCHVMSSFHFFCYGYGLTDALATHDSSSWAYHTGAPGNVKSRNG
jgi:hypothetical protein